MVPFARTAAVFDVDDSLLDGNAGTIFTWYLFSEKIMRPEMRARVPRIVYDYARKRLTEQDMVEVGSRCQHGLRADVIREHAHACFEKHLRKRITTGAVRQVRKHLLSGHLVVLASGSPAHTSGRRRSVLTAVEASPVPHSVPGSVPIWPSESIAVPSLASTIASSPLNHPLPLVWSAWSRIVGIDDACASTNTSPAATEPVRGTVSPAVVLPLKYICTE